MKFSSFATLAAIASAVHAKDVSCRVNGQEVAIVDLDSGSCPFSIPENLPVTFRFDAEDDYEVDAYYVTADQKYWNDIENAGRQIAVPANQLYGKGPAPIFHVHDEEKPGSNSTAALRRRFNAQFLAKRDPKDDLVGEIRRTVSLRTPLLRLSMLVLQPPPTTPPSLRPTPVLRLSPSPLATTTTV